MFESCWEPGSSSVHPAGRDVWMRPFIQRGSFTRKRKGWRQREEKIVSNASSLLFHIFTPSSSPSLSPPLYFCRCHFCCCGSSFLERLSSTVWGNCPRILCRRPSRHRGRRCSSPCCRGRKEHLEEGDEEMVRKERMKDDRCNDFLKKWKRLGKE